MKLIVIFILVTTLSSCDFFQSQEKRTQELIDAELREIDWNAIDAYPLFLGCDEDTTKETQRRCFEQKLSEHLYTALRKIYFVVETGEQPSASVVFVVDTTGKIEILSIERSKQIIQQQPDFDKIITESLLSVPQIAPALKRGMPVKVKFRIPIELNTK